LSSEGQSIPTAAENRVFEDMGHTRRVLWRCLEDDTKNFVLVIIAERHHLNPERDHCDYDESQQLPDEEASSGLLAAHRASPFVYMHLCTRLFVSVKRSLCLIFFDPLLADLEFGMGIKEICCAYMRIMIPFGSHELR